MGKGESTDRQIDTGVVRLAVDEVVQAPAREPDDDQVHRQVEEQEWCCYISAHSSHDQTKTFKPQHKLKQVAMRIPVISSLIFLLRLSVAGVFFLSFGLCVRKQDMRDI